MAHPPAVEAAAPALAGPSTASPRPPVDSGRRTCKLEDPPTRPYHEAVSRSLSRFGATTGILLLLPCCGPTVALPSGDGSGSSSTADESSGDSTTGELPPPQPVPPNPTPPPLPDPTTGGGESSGGSSTGPVEVPIWEDIPPWELPDTCAWLEDEQAYCLLVTSEDTTLYGVDSGEECDIGDPDVSIGERGMAWIGMSTAACHEDSDGSGVVQLTRLDTGELAELPTSCSSVTSDRDILYIGYDGFFEEWEPLRSFLEYADVVTESPDREFALNSGVHRLVVADNIAWRAWHAADSLERFSLDADEELPELPIPEHDDWVFGFAAVNNMVLIGNSSQGSGTLGLFDATSGVLLELRELSRGRVVRQLNCRSTLK